MQVEQFKDIFLQEAKEHLQKLNDNLLKYEKEGNKKILDELMRSAHTVKSSSATMGYNKIAFLTHVLEDVFDYGRNDLLEISSELINISFEALDALEAALKEVEENNQEIDLDDIAKKIKELTGVKTEGIGKSKRTDSGKPVVKTEDSNYKIEDVDEVTHIKVPIERLDNLMDLTEELLIDKLKLENLRQENPELDKTVDHLSSLISSLQHQVMQTRLVPLEQIFARFPRMIRDLAKKTNKEINFIIQGSELELDRTIVDKLGEPIVHLLRNAVDHGIKEKGEIILKAKRLKDYTVLEVINNGNSIDLEKIKKSAIKRNIVSSSELEKMKEEQILDLIFHPQLSTKEEVTETSGRGVGMSVVKKFVESIGGRIIIDSLPEGGTKFTLELPLTLAIINALMVEVKGTLFAIPFSSIERVVRIPQKNIKSIGDHDVAVVDGTDVPLANLEKIFEFKEEKEESVLLNKNVVLVRRGNDLAGLIIDEVLNEQEIIVKTLPSVLHGTRGFSGSTILGDGKTILILDVISLLEDTKKLLRVK